MADFEYPLATYRLQLNKDFRFAHAEALVDYFSALGITDIYASPILGSRKGSQHGYDVTDPTRIDPDIGSAQDFGSFESKLLSRGMRLLLDIVPNHMAAGSENRWWMDVLEKGHASQFASYFDIDWHPPSRSLDGKVFLPVLGRPFGEVLDRGELQLILQDGKCYFRYFDSVFPLAPSSYHRILTHRIEELKKTVPVESPTYLEFAGIVAGLSSATAAEPSYGASGSEGEPEKRVRLDALRERLHTLLETHPEVAAFIQNNIAEINGAPGDPASRNLLESLLREQHFRLAYWLEPNEGINYRRFFAVSELVGVRSEDPLVFDATHDFILRLAGTGVVRGLRVDHIDGLRDPVGYLNRLRDRILQVQASGDPYILVEKILSGQEILPDDWNISGSTGYEYLNIANGIFVSPAGAQGLKNVYSQFVGKEMDFGEVVYEKKKLVMNTLLRVEMRALGRQLAELAASDRYARNLLRMELLDVLIEVTACFPVYRTYTRNLEVSEESIRHIDQAVNEARRRRPRLSPECFAFLHDVLVLANPPHVLSEQREERLAFVMRWQQFTGPIVAKGVEDTALYVYHPLLSLNEVGGNPDPARVASREDCFRFISERQPRWPDTINASSTHDTKRSEDVRARLNALSEIPDEWAAELAVWSKENDSLKETADGRKVPDPNEEYLIYQTLVGLWPSDLTELPTICERMQAYVVKAIREAMVHTRWTEPNLPHENAIFNFIQQILKQDENNAFLHHVTRFQEKVSYAGMLNSLGQTLLKIAAPGVPDFYQGSELWDFHLVDPDNRSAVDFDLRQQGLKDISERPPSVQTAKELLAGWTDGRVKLYVIWKSLGCRRSHARLFRDGEFVPLEVVGPAAEHVIAFSRKLGEEEVVAVIPRWTFGFIQKADQSFPSESWRDTRLLLPAGSANSWHNVLTTETVASQTFEGTSSLAVRDVLKDFPVALLTAVG